MKPPSRRIQASASDRFVLVSKSTPDRWIGNFMAETADRTAAMKFTAAYLNHTYWDWNRFYNPIPVNNKLSSGANGTKA